MAINALQNSQQKMKPTSQSFSIFKGFAKKVFNKQSIFKNYQKNFVNQLKNGHTLLTEEQIKTSKLYQKLQKRLQNAIFVQNSSIKNHNQIMQNLEKEKQIFKFEIKEEKIRMWQLKNEILDLQQLLKEQQQTYQQLAYLQNSEDQNSVDDEEQLSNYYSEKDEGQNYQYQQQEQLQQTGQNECEQEEISKPSCSIKYFITGEQSNQNSSKMLSSSNRILSEESQQTDFTILYKKESCKQCNVKIYCQKENVNLPSQAFGKKICSRILNTTKQI